MKPSKSGEISSGLQTYQVSQGNRSPDSPGIIYPPTLDFDYLVQRPQQLLKSISQLGVTVYFLNHPAYHQGQYQGIERYNQHLFLFHHTKPSYPPTTRPVVYYSNPSQVELIHSYNPCLIVFDSLDEPVDEFSPWQPYYHRAVSSADLVLAASDKLYTRAQAINPHTGLLPNGCDYDYFNRARSNRFAPPDLPQLGRAVIGYMGAVASWCDLELLDKLAQVFSDCSLLIIGPLYNVRNIPLHPNIHWLGYKAYEDLIYYASYFDVGIIPFKQSDMTAAVNPIKMWEYMAMGIPVVTTALPETQKYSEELYYSPERQDFINNVWRALKQENWEKCERRMSLAQENSWMARAKVMLEAIQERLREKGVKVQETLPIPASATPYKRKNWFYQGEHVRFQSPARKYAVPVQRENTRPSANSTPTPFPAINSSRLGGVCQAKRWPTVYSPEKIKPLPLSIDTGTSSLAISSQTVNSFHYKSGQKPVRSGEYPC